MDTLLANQGIVRTTIFAFLCLSLIALETIFPRRKPQLAKGNRWLINFGFSGINIIFMRLILPIGLASVAAKFYGQFGLLIWLQLTCFLDLWIALILLDFDMFWQHRLFHNLTLLFAFL